MRVQAALFAALLAGISVACSKPASNSSQQPEADREIRLVDAPAPGAPVVSDLEAGLGSRLTAARSAPQSSGESRMVHRAASPAAGETVPSAEPALPSVALTEVAAQSVAAPATTFPILLAGSRIPSAAARGDGSATTGDIAPSGGTRGPVILIRGGMGAPDDDCKLHPVARRGVGIAIHNLAPTPGGRVAVNNRLPRGTGGFTRIR